MTALETAMQRSYERFRCEQVAQRVRAGDPVAAAEAEEDKLDRQFSAALDRVIKARA